MCAERKIDVAPWVSCRSYFLNEEHKSIIYNNKIGKSLVLESWSSIIWSHIVDGLALVEIHERIGKESNLNQEEINVFFRELELQELFISSTQSNEHNIGINEEEILTNDDPSQEIQNEFNEWLISNNQLTSAFIETTYRCNEKCLHCFNPGAAHEIGEVPKRNTNELTFDQYKDVIDELYDLGIWSICLSGGEFFLRKDAFEILNYINFKKLRTTIYTNGTKLKEDKLRKICETYPHQVHISIYSSNPKNHDDFTQVPGSWSKSMRTIRYLVSNNIKVVMKASLTSKTCFEYEELNKIAQEIGCAIMYETIISAGNDRSLKPISLNVTDFNTLVNLSAGASSPWYVGTYRKNINREIDKPCYIGESSVSINPEGKVYPCVAMPVEVADIKKPGNLKEEWNKHSGKDQNSLNYWKNYGYSSTEECGSHTRCSFCFRCHGGAYGATGDSRKPSEIQCLHASARERAAKHLEDGLKKDEIQRLYPIKDSKLIPAVNV